MHITQSISCFEDKVYFYCLPAIVITCIFHKCVVNVIPVANPTQYTKSGKYVVKYKVRQLF